MAFRYACFISYCHGQYDLVKGFIDQLKTALKAELDALMNEELYIDEERLLPGYHYNEELAKAICESVCMVVVYMPKYESHEYCMREFEAMELLERKRDQLLGAAANASRGFTSLGLRSLVRRRVRRQPWRRSPFQILRDRRPLMSEKPEDFWASRSCL